MIVGARIPANLPRILIPAGEDPAVIRFAAKYAKAQNAAVVSLYVKERADPQFEHLPSHGREAMTLAHDPAARAAFNSTQRWCGREGVPVLKLFTIHSCLGEVLLDHAVTWGVDAVIMGATRRKELPPIEADPHLTQVYAQLPRSIPLVIHT